jgi:hypothetical protein
MTKAQKENQARFKKVQAEAKKLKAKNPRLTHIEAVKRAWAIISPKSGNKPKTKSTVGSAKKTVAKKKVAKKISGKLSLTRKETRLGYVGKAPAKKKAVKKVGAVKKPTVARHKDVKSHNVRISVMSGVKVKGDMSKRYMDIVKDIAYYQDSILQIGSELQYMDVKSKKRAREVIKQFKNIVQELKTHAKELKKLI